jgi:hypothetical protein
MKKSVILFSLLLLLPAALFSFDWGVVIDNSSTLDFGEAIDTELAQRDKVSFWAEHFWSGTDESQYMFMFNGFYLYTDERAYLFDADRLEFRLKKAGIYNSPTVLDLSLGRFRFADTTATVLNHGADGISLDLDFSILRMKTAIGYTGLQLKPEAGVEMSAADVADGNDDDVYFAPKRLFEQLVLQFPELAPRQRLTVETLFQQDLREETADRLNSVHATAKADGAIAGGFYYDISATGGWDVSNNVNGLMTAAALRYFAEQYLGSRASLGLILTGEDFLTVSTPTFGLVYAPSEADLLRIAFDYSMRPWSGRLSPALRNLQFLTGLKYFAVPGDGYTGMELEGGINFRPSSDFGASLKGGLWLPDGGDTQGLVRLEFSLGL